MKIQPRDVERILAAPPDGALVLLLYGPDTGLVKERAQTAIKAVAGAADDPFRVQDVPFSALRDEPGRLRDEAASMSLTGGKRAIRLRDAGDGAAASVELALELDAADALIVLEAGELGPQSRLRKLCEADPHALAVPCYSDDTRALGDVIRETLGAHGLTPDDDAMAYLSQSLGADRQVTRSELEKLALYVGAPGKVTFEDAAACVGDSAALAGDDIALAAFGSDPGGLARALDRAALEGVQPIAILRSAARHARRLQIVAARVEGGMAIDKAIGGLRPPVFFKARDRFAEQVRRWPAARLDDALAMLEEAEIGCKTTGMPAETLCGRALMRLAARGRPAARR